MPMYFFHVREHGQIVEDTDGADLPDLAAAREEAIVAAREILADMLRMGQIVDGQEFLIVDEQGNELATVPFRSTIRSN